MDLHASYYFNGVLLWVCFCCGNLVGFAERVVNGCMVEGGGCVGVEGLVMGVAV